MLNEVGDKLDPNKEQENEEATIDGVIDEHPELCILDPTEFLENGTNDTQQQIFRKTELLDDQEIKDKVLKLDKEQRLVIDIGTNYAKKLVQAEKKNRPRPTAPLVIVHGGAGTGKSTVIDAMSQVLEKIFQETRRRS